MEKKNKRTIFYLNKRNSRKLFKSFHLIGIYSSVKLKKFQNNYYTPLYIIRVRTDSV